MGPASRVYPPGVTRWTEIARATSGDDYAAKYAARFRALAQRGEDVHGEADFVTRLAPPPAAVLDAGCGTGRIAIRLADLGHAVVGVDVDPSMLDQARRDAPELVWRLADLSTLDLGRVFDVVLVTGNTIPLLEPGTLAPTAACLAEHLSRDGLLVGGFGLDPQHLPPGCPVTPLAEVEEAFAAAGLEQVERFSTWAGGPFEGGYAVLVHRLGDR